VRLPQRIRSWLDDLRGFFFFFFFETMTCAVACLDLGRQSPRHVGRSVGAKITTSDDGLKHTHRRTD
jgi:hypothetical protein